MEDDADAALAFVAALSFVVTDDVRAVRWCRHGGAPPATPRWCGSNLLDGNSGDGVSGRADESEVMELVSEDIDGVRLCPEAVRVLSECAMEGVSACDGCVFSARGSEGTVRDRGRMKTFQKGASFVFSFSGRAVEYVFTDVVLGPA